MEPAPDGSTELGHAALARIRIVLVEPSHPGNIGATARAMKAMGLGQLALVNPRDFPSATATARASGADDLLVSARLYPSLEAAIADCGVVVGTTARTRHLEWPVLSPRELAPWLLAQSLRVDAALVFGREQAGLSNVELSLCQRAVRIPTNPEFSSLNIAQAVQVCAYELRVAALTNARSQTVEGEPLANVAELTGATTHLLSVMSQVSFYDPERPKLLPMRLQRFLNGNQIRRSEVQILRGFLTDIEARLREKTD